MVDTSGNTPTGVGKTVAFKSNSRPGQKHPHRRGEDYASKAKRVDEKETPPQAWGRPSKLDLREEHARNTPTGVGKTRIGLGSQAFRWKHPHRRGEDSKKL